MILERRSSFCLNLAWGGGYLERWACCEVAGGELCFDGGGVYWMEEWGWVGFGCFFFFLNFGKLWG